MKIKRLFGGAPSLALAVATAAPADRGGGASDPFGPQRLLAEGKGDSGSEDKKTVRARRRRRSEPAGPEGRKRAEAPRRRKPEERPRPPSGTGGGQRPPARPPRPSGGGLPGVS